MLVNLSNFYGFDQIINECISNFVRLRNILTHEYLDIKWKSIQNFLLEAEPLYKEFISQVKSYINKNI